MKIPMTLAAAVLALALLPAAAGAQSSGAPKDGKTQPEGPMVLPEVLNCLFDRAWSCRHRGCLVSTRKVTIRIDTKTMIVCRVRGEKCSRPMKFVMTQQRGGFSGSVAKRGMLFFVDRRLRISVAQIRRRRIFAVYGRCKAVTQ